MAASPSRWFTFVVGLLAGSCTERRANDTLTPEAEPPREFELANLDTGALPQFRDLPSPPRSPPPPKRAEPPPPVTLPPETASPIPSPEVVTLVPSPPETGTVAVGVPDGQGANPVLLFTRTPKPFPGNLAPRYPAWLEVAGIPGKVVVRFVVDTAGRVEMATLTVLASTNPAFTAAVRDAMPQWRFQAAAVGGRKVRQVVQIPILFSVPR